MTRRFASPEKVLYLAAFALTLLLPWAALATGNRTELDERVEPAPRPSLAPRNWLNPATWDSMDVWLSDNLPLHDEAVRSTASVDYHLFEDSNNVEAVVGADGWVYSRPELDAYCPTDVGYLESVSVAFKPAEMVSLMEVLTHLVELTGRDLWWTLPPSRWYAYPDKLNARSARLATCAGEFRAELRAQLDQAAMPHVVQLWDDIDTARVKAEALGPVEVPGFGPAGFQAPDLIYYPHDLHWNTRGAAVMSQRIIDAMSPGLWDDSALVPVSFEDKDATQLRSLGLEGFDRDIRYGVVRPGVSARVTGEYIDNEFLSPTILPEDQWYLRGGQVPGSIVCDCPGLGRLDDHPLLTFEAQTDDPAKLILGHTLWLHDSFSWWATGQLPAYFESLSMMRGKTVEAPTAFHDEFNAANRVVVAFSEMLFTRRLDPAFPLVRRLVEESAAYLSTNEPTRVQRGTACTNCTPDGTWTSPAADSTWTLPAKAFDGIAGPFLVTVEVAPTTFTVDPQGVVVDKAMGLARPFNPLGYEPALIQNGKVVEPHRYNFYLDATPQVPVEFTIAKEGTRIESYSIISLADAAGSTDTER